MGKRQTHPSVEEFKDFVRRHPKLIEEVRSGRKQWQTVFEDWYLLGENDVIWKSYKSEDSRTDKGDNSGAMNQFSTLLSSLKKLDANQINQHLYQASNVISSIQGLLETFGLGNKKTETNRNRTNNPFTFRKD